MDWPPWDLSNSQLCGQQRQLYYREDAIIHAKVVLFVNVIEDVVMSTDSFLYPLLVRT